MSDLFKNAKKVKKLVVNLKGAETINLKKIMVNGKKKLVPATEIDEYKIYGIDLNKRFLKKKT